MNTTPKFLKYGSMVSVSSPSVLNDGVEHAENSENPEFDLSTIFSKWNMALIFQNIPKGMEDLKAHFERVNPKTKGLPYLNASLPKGCVTFWSDPNALVASTYSIFKIGEAIDIVVVSLKFGSSWLTMVFDLNWPEVSEAIRAWQAAGVIPAIFHAQGGGLATSCMVLDDAEREPLQNVALNAEQIPAEERMYRIFEAFEKVPELRAKVPAGSQLSLVCTMRSIALAMNSDTPISLSYRHPIKLSE